MKFEQTIPKPDALPAANAFEESLVNPKSESKVGDSEVESGASPTVKVEKGSNDLVEHPPKRKLGSAAARLYARGLKNKEKKDEVVKDEEIQPAQIESKPKDPRRKIAEDRSMETVSPPDQNDPPSDTVGISNPVFSNLADPQDPPMGENRTSAGR